MNANDPGTDALAGRTVLVTGATGFIGGRLASRLARAGAHVTGTGRNLRAAAHLEEEGVRLRHADLLDFRTMAELVRGQELIFHVAAWLGERHGGPEMAWPINVYATRTLAEQTARAGARRLVLVSSIAAYGPPKSATIDESQRVDPLQPDSYGRTKAEGELQARESARRNGLQLAVVRPGMVYGPHSYGWSLRMFRLVQRGVPVIAGDGTGHAHPVYVDNLIDGMLLAATHPEAVDEAFNFVDRPLPWRIWFEWYGTMAGRRPRRLPFWVVRLGLAAAVRLPLDLSIGRELLDYYTARAVYPTTKAERLLGYRPRVSLEDGMARTEEWLREAGHL
ncbi:MAG: NAD-dependent epimerase/dehydratase family protein [Candidatus Promineifilaceae bacterium]|nr:NAD-dependent epimerase/dehydratase family protein [Candidatus Promineifilaceae bacterium]